MKGSMGYMTENKRFTYSNTYGWTGTGFLKVMNGLDEKNKKLKERIKQQEQLISEQAIQLDYLKDENRHMSEVLDENKQLKQQLHDFVQLANENDKTLNELYQYGVLF